MTKPSDAQIEAAKKAHRAFMWDILNVRKPTEKDEDKAIAVALTAAAEVGDDNGWNYAERLNLAIKNTQAATIERCAQVVRRYTINIGEMAEIIANEIEALKDKT